MASQKLELTWVDKAARPELEPRIPLEDPARSDCAKHRETSNDIFGNGLIFGGNLPELKTQVQDVGSEVWCVFNDLIATADFVKDYREHWQHQERKARTCA